MSPAEPNPYAPPTSNARPDRSFTHTTPGGSRLAVRPRDDFTAFIAGLNCHLRVALGLIPPVVALALAYRFLSHWLHPDWALTIGLVASFIVLILSFSAISGNPRRVEFAAHSTGLAVEIAFRPRLEAESAELRLDTAEDIGSLQMVDGQLCFVGSCVSLELQPCDIERVTTTWRSVVPTLRIDLTDAFTYQRFSLYVLHTGPLSLWHSHRAAKSIAADIPAPKMPG